MATPLKPDQQTVPEVATAEPNFTYRLAVNPDTGEHGYEIGRWKPGADVNNPDDFYVAEKCYGQVEAFQRTTALNALDPLDQPKPPQIEPPAKAEEDEPHGRHSASRHRR